MPSSTLSTTWPRCRPAVAVSGYLSIRLPRPIRVGRDRSGSRPARLARIASAGWLSSASLMALVCSQASVVSLAASIPSLGALFGANHASFLGSRRGGSNNGCSQAETTRRCRPLAEGPTCSGRLLELADRFLRLSHASIAINQLFNHQFPAIQIGSADEIAPSHVPWLMPPSSIADLFHLTLRH